MDTPPENRQEKFSYDINDGIHENAAAGPSNIPEVYDTSQLEFHPGDYAITQEVGAQRAMNGAGSATYIQVLSCGVFQRCKWNRH